MNAMIAVTFVQLKTFSFEYKICFRAKIRISESILIAYNIKVYKSVVNDEWLDPLADDNGWHEPEFLADAVNRRARGQQRERPPAARD